MIILLLLVLATYMYGVVIHAHPVRSESHNQRNTTREAATKVSRNINVTKHSLSIIRQEHRHIFKYIYNKVLTF